MLPTFPHVAVWGSLCLPSDGVQSWGSRRDVLYMLNSAHRWGAEGEACSASSRAAVPPLLLHAHCILTSAHSLLAGCHPLMGETSSVTTPPLRDWPPPSRQLMRATWLHPARP